MKRIGKDIYRLQLNKLPKNNKVYGKIIDNYKMNIIQFNEENLTLDSIDFMSENKSLKSINQQLHPVPISPILDSKNYITNKFNEEKLTEHHEPISKKKSIQESMSNYKLAQLIIQENNIIVIDKNVYFANEQLGYFVGLVGEEAEIKIRQSTPEKYKALINSRSIREIIYWIKSFKELEINKDILTKHNMYINFSNCVVHVKDLKIYEHSLEFYFTNYIDVEYPKYTLPCNSIFEEFINQITGDNQALYNRIQEIFGYVLSEIRDLKSIFYFLGPKDSGKSIVISLLREIVGNQFCSSISLSDFNDRFRLSQLYRKKLNCCGETSEITLSRLDIIKSASGNDYLTGEVKGYDPFPFINKAALLFAGNNLPHIKGIDTTNAFIKRLVIVPFNNPVPKSKQDVNLLDKLLKEKSYIVYWSLLGLNRLIENNYAFTTCYEVEDIYNEYLYENNSVQLFIDNECIIDYKFRIHTYKLEEAYRSYCKKYDLIPVEEKLFHKILQSLPGLKNERFRLNGENRKGYIGLQLSNPLPHNN